jgi:hypothetical protein
VPENAIVRDPAPEFDEGILPLTYVARPDGSYALDPSEKCVVTVILGKTVAEWAETDGQDVLTAEFSATNPAGTVTDTWSVAIDACVLEPKQGELGRWVERPTVPMKAKISSPVRTYAG